MKKSVIALLTLFVVFGTGFIAGQMIGIPVTKAKEAEVIPVISSHTTTPELTPTDIPTPMPVSEEQRNLPASGPRKDILEITPITADKNIAQVGDDIHFTVTIKNTAPYKKHIKAVCFNSTDGNFGCTRDFNLFPEQSFNVNNSGRFTSGGNKSIWITWTQDEQNYYRPVNGSSVNVQIQN